jgi:hypothetical protein
MSQSNGKSTDGVIRVGRKGCKKFAFGEDGKPFEVDVVVALYQWIEVDEGFRNNGEEMTDPKTGRVYKVIPTEDMARYHASAVKFATELAGGEYNEVNGSSLGITTAEALDFIARLREQHDELVDFFLPRRRGEPESQDTSGVELQFSEEPAPSHRSTSASSSV